LIKDNIIIRDCSNFIGLSDKYFRVAVRTREENQKLLSALNLIMDDVVTEGTNQKDVVKEYVVR
jgi:threonine-phosphate decarboxylase